MKKLEIRIGRKFNRWSVIKEVEGQISKQGRYLRKLFCKCECGKKKEVYFCSLQSGKSKSCGCLNKEIITTHGKSRTPIWNVFEGMKKRCYNPNSKDFKYYGGRGIIIKWKSFQKFLDDMYKSYLKHVELHGEKNTTIERIDVNGNYESGNCIWVTRLEQGKNKRNNVKHKGKCISEWIRELKLNKNTIFNRINNLGWAPEKAIFTPVKKLLGMN